MAIAGEEELLIQRMLAAAAECDRFEEANLESLPDSTAVLERCGSWGVRGQLKPHQAEGVAWLIHRYVRGVNVILGDEMGLGKTLQALVLLAYLKEERHCRGPYLILCPLSVIEGWVSDMNHFVPGLKFLRYLGSKVERRKIWETLCEHINCQPPGDRIDPTLPFDVFLTTYDLAMKDATNLSRVLWRYAIIDEAQRLKNYSTVLYTILEERYLMPRRLLLTGTPIQNNVSELWSLLHFCMPLVFGDLQHFVAAFEEVSTTAPSEVDSGRQDYSNSRLSVLRHVLRAFMLRRTKAALVHSRVLTLPPLSEVSIIAPMVPLQKEVYVSILKRELPRLVHQATQGSLQNIVMQLRKACSHPYLFEGIEPEPFEEGEHLVQASGKLLVLDAILKKLKSSQHRALIFAQMTRTLDILQDYLELRGYIYERLDGSIRAEERFAAVRSFSSSHSKMQGVVNNDVDRPFVFLLTTRAGGVGLNLAAADTVIFYEQDWNPQADKQALQRAHRIGQHTAVLSINLITQHTIEEVIMYRARRKLILANEVIGQDSLQDDASLEHASGTDLQNLIMFGLHKLGPVDKRPTDGLLPSIEEVVVKALDVRGGKTAPQNTLTEDEDQAFYQNIYQFEGSDFSKERGKDHITSEDKAVFDSLSASKVGDDTTDIAGRIRRSHKQFNEKRVPAPKGQHDESAKMKRWKALQYNSLSVDDLDDGGSSSFFSDEEADVHFVIGDCTKPKLTKPDEAAIIMICLDNSGTWGSGGMFGALGALSAKVEDAYQKAHEAGDLHLGDVHLVDLSGEPMAGYNHGHMKIWVALAVVQTYDRRRKIARSDISYSDLEICLRKVARIAVTLDASVHLPRIGGGTEQGRKEWYIVERLLRKFSSSYHIPFYVYYFKRTYGGTIDS